MLRRRKKGVIKMNSEELKHYGIKGQKWGRRRYQNSDGSLTPAGKQRYGDGGKMDLQDTKKLVDKTNDVAKQSQRINDEKRSKKEKKAKQQAEQDIREKVYKMSDQELRDAVNRMNMEERYTQVMRDRTNVEVGKTKVEKFMDYTVSGLTIASTTISIAMMLQEMRKK